VETHQLISSNCNSCILLSLSALYFSAKRTYFLIAFYLLLIYLPTPIYISHSLFYNNYKIVYKRHITTSCFLRLTFRLTLHLTLSHTLHLTFSHTFHLTLVLTLSYTSIILLLDMIIIFFLLIVIHF